MPARPSPRPCRLSGGLAASAETMPSSNGAAREGVPLDGLTGGSRFGASFFQSRHCWFRHYSGLFLSQNSFVGKRRDQDDVIRRDGAWSGPGPGTGHLRHFVRSGGRTLAFACSENGVRTGIAGRLPDRAGTRMAPAPPLPPPWLARRVKQRRFFQTRHFVCPVLVEDRRR